MRGRRRLRSLLLYLCYVFRALIKTKRGFTFSSWQQEWLTGLKVLTNCQQNNALGVLNVGHSQSRIAKVSRRSNEKTYVTREA